MNTIAKWGIALLVSACLACGDDPGDLSEVEADPQASEGSASNAVATDPNVRPPRINDLRLDPSNPQSGDKVRAVATLAKSSMEYKASTHFTYTWTLGGVESSDGSASITVPELTRGATVRVSVVATNPGGSSAPTVAEARIPNAAPRITDLRVRPDDSSVDEEVWMAEVRAHDPDGDPIDFHYTWIVNGKPSTHRGDRFPTSKLKRGDSVRVRIVASDGMNDGPASESGTIEVANSAPDIVSSPPRLSPNGRFRYRIDANDADGDRNLKYELVRGPRGMEMDGFGGELTWMPEEDQVGDHEIEIAVDDGKGGRATQVFVLPIIVKEGGASPASIR